MAKRARLPDDVPQGQELATRRKQQTIHSAARRRAEFNALITELDGTLKAAEPEKGAVGEKGSGGKVQILERAASEFKEIENDSAPRKVKRLPQELSSKLKAEKASFHEMWKHSQVGVFMATPKMEALDANPYLLKTMDYRPFEVKHLWNLVHPDSLHTAYREVGQVATGKQKYARVQARLKHKDGSYHWCLTRDCCGEDKGDCCGEDKGCLLYTSDAADEEDSVDLGGRRIIKKKKKQTINMRAYRKEDVGVKHRDIKRR
eukprot:TRINITY_DN8266_c0_g1_i4.p1 TRINITY_DN8266_c0_g1~~TRINITY_DN8266_c0_g1_i4.p1  ORF type:complete len:261 (-),score=57.33 TRINITY_DN8266_c0_g1_i4:24-806(-)